MRGIIPQSSDFLIPTAGWNAARGDNSYVSHIIYKGHRLERALRSERHAAPEGTAKSAQKIPSAR
jgi:hypothetical protein